MKHTPGPWTAVFPPGMKGPGVHIKARHDTLEVAYANTTENERPEADARLIAAAPEMLEALELVLNDNRLMNAMNKEQARAIPDAIRKARG